MSDINLTFSGPQLFMIYLMTGILPLTIATALCAYWLRRKRRSRVALVALIVFGVPWLGSAGGWLAVGVSYAHDTIASHFYQNGPAVKKFAVGKMLESVQRQEDRESLYYVFHQANYRLLQEVVMTAKIPTERHFCNVDRFGNCASAGSTSVLSQNWELFHSRSMRINLAVIGGGLSWGMATILT